MAPVYAFDHLVPGQSITGPAIIESPMTTILLRPREQATTTPFCWLDITLSETT
jgi:N-methylhydantoinase A/oxoprolinase/acetone carboxylase beta subunit